MQLIERLIYILTATVNRIRNRNSHSETEPSLFRMSDSDVASNSENHENQDQELLIPPQRDNTHSTTNLETLMHIFKVYYYP